MRRIFLTLFAALWLGAATSALSEEVRVVRQYGIGYLQLMIMEKNKLIEKHAEAAGLVRRRANHRALAAPGNDHGTPAQLRVIALLHGSVEGIHVDVDDLAEGHAG